MGGEDSGKNFQASSRLNLLQVGVKGMRVGGERKLTVPAKVNFLFRFKSFSSNVFSTAWLWSER